MNGSDGPGESFPEKSVNVFCWLKLEEWNQPGNRTGSCSIPKMFSKAFCLRNISLQKSHRWEIETQVEQKIPLLNWTTRQALEHWTGIGPNKVWSRMIFCPNCITWPETQNEKRWIIRQTHSSLQPYFKHSQKNVSYWRFLALATKLKMCRRHSLQFEPRPMRQTMDFTCRGKWVVTFGQVPCVDFISPTHGPGRSVGPLWHSETAMDPLHTQDEKDC